MPCKQCGACCRDMGSSCFKDAIIKARASIRRLNFRFINDRIIDTIWFACFIRENNKGRYRCTLVTKNGRCPLHFFGIKPQACVGYGEEYRPESLDGKCQLYREWMENH